MSSAFYEARRKDGARRRGNASAWWSGDDATYTARHKRVRRARGRAADYLCAKHLELGVEKAASDWAQVHDTDGLDLWADYLPLCRFCHLHYDQIIETRRPVAWTPEMRAKRSANTTQLWQNPAHKARRNTALPKPPHGPHNRDKDECPEGHKYTPQNTYTGKRKDGTTFRKCKICHNTKAKARRQVGKNDHAPHPRETWRTP